MLNLTQHARAEGQHVTDLSGADLVCLKNALTFDDMPSSEEMAQRAAAIVDLAVANLIDAEWTRLSEAGGDLDACDYEVQGSAMIGGAPFFMPVLAEELRNAGITPYYAFSKRVSTETNGVKTSVFKHEGFIPHFQE